MRKKLAKLGAEWRLISKPSLKDTVKGTTRVVLFTGASVLAINGIDMLFQTLLKAIL